MDGGRLVLYIVEITEANQGAWYRDKIGRSFKSVLSLVEKQISGEKMIVFKVIGSKHATKYILPLHCRVKDQKTINYQEFKRYE
jgi:hypothetical protein